MNLSGLLGTDYEDPQSQALLAAGLSMLANSGPSLMPRSLGQIIGVGGQAGMEQYSKRKKEKLLEEESLRRNEEARLEKLIKEATLQKYKDQQLEQERLNVAAKGAYESPLGEANRSAFEQTGLPLGRIENAAPQAAAAKNATGGLNQDLFMRLALEQGVSPFSAARSASEFNKAEGPMQILPPGAVGVRNGQVIASNPMAEKQRDQWDDIGHNARGQLLQKNRSTGEVRAVGAGPAANTTVQMPPLERAEQGEKGKANVQYYATSILPEANAARKANAFLESQSKVLDSGFTTGWGKEQIATGANILGSLFGVRDAEKYASMASTFQSAMYEQVLQKQLAQKGPQTESDAQRMQQTLANINTPVSASRFLIDFAKSQNDRSINKQKFFDNWWRKHNTYEGAEEAWNDSEGGLSIFESPRMKPYSSSSDSGGWAIRRK